MHPKALGAAHGEGKAGMTMRKALRRLAAFFYPERCPFCDKPVPFGKAACPECLARVPRDAQTVCTACGRPVTIAKGHTGCNGFPCVTPFYYDGAVRQAVLRLKFHGRRQYAQSLSAFAFDALEAAAGGRVDAVVYVPMVRRAERERGYNQAGCFAKALAARLGVPCAHWLVKLRQNAPQRSLSAEERHKNVQGVFACRTGVPVEGKRILLCDDIITTGATLQECARLLMENGAASVVCCAIAHTALARVKK